MKVVYYKGNEFDLHKNTQSFTFEWTRFETETCSNSEMGYWTYKNKEFYE